MASQSTMHDDEPLGPWVDELFRRIFFQPDDEMAMETYEHCVAPEFAATINHDHLTSAQFLEAIKQTRAKNLITVQDSQEIQIWEAPDKRGTGCVAHLSHFTLTGKADGKEDKQSSLTLANVQVHEGKRMLFALTEVAK